MLQSYLCGCALTCFVEMTGNFVEYIGEEDQKCEIKKPKRARLSFLNMKNREDWECRGSRVGDDMGE